MVELIHIDVPHGKYDDEMWWWCHEHFGPVGKRWYYVNGSKKGYYNFDFDNKELAAQFVLRWL